MKLHMDTYATATNIAKSIRGAKAKKVNDRRAIINKGGETIIIVEKSNITLNDRYMSAVDKVVSNYDCIRESVSSLAVCFNANTKINNKPIWK